MRDEKVSIIIPTYKRSPLLVRAIDSVLNQTYKNIEVIVIDDNGEGTTFQEETEKIIKKYSKDERVKYIRHKINKNGSAARNTGIKNSEGEYIGFLDDDDYYLETRVENLVDKLKSNEKYLGALSNYELHQNGTVFKKGYIDRKNINLKNFLMVELDIGTGSNLFFKRCILEKLSGFKEDFKRHQDLEMLGRVLREGKIAHVDKVLVVKEQENYNVRTNTEILIETKKKFLKLFEDDINRFSKDEQEKIYFKHTFALFKISFKTRKLINTVKFLLECLKTPMLFYRRIM